MKLDVAKIQTDQRDRLLSQFQDATSRMVEGKDRYNRMKLECGNALAAAWEKVAVRKMEADMARLQGRHVKNEEQSKLLQYQIDTYNNILVGMYGFAERRNDEYPDLSQIAQLCVSLGDQGATSTITG